MDEVIKLIENTISQSASKDFRSFISEFSDVTKVNIMKVYFDQQIWALLENGSLDEAIINRAAEQLQYEYYLSVAHLEELHNSEKKETDDKKGITERLEIFMKKHSVPGVIKETEGCVKFHSGEEEYIIARNTVWKYDTMDDVQILSDIGLSEQKNNGIDPKNLFEGRKYDPVTEYKDVWEIQSVKQLLRNYGVENVKYQPLKGNFLELNTKMTLVFEVLADAGYKRDKNKKLHNSGAYDIQHAIRATYCDMFVTNDKKLESKYKAVAYYMEIPIEILSFEEFARKIDL